MTRTDYKQNAALIPLGPETNPSINLCAAPMARAIAAAHHPPRAPHRTPHAASSRARSSWKLQFMEKRIFHGRCARRRGVWAPPRGGAGGAQVCRRRPLPVSARTSPRTHAHAVYRHIFVIATSVVVSAQLCTCASDTVIHIHTHRSCTADTHAWSATAAATHQRQEPLPTASSE